MIPTLRAITVTMMLCLVAVPVASSWADQPDRADPREREIRRAREHREQEMQQATRERYEDQIRTELEEKVAQEELEKKLERLQDELYDLRSEQLELRVIRQAIVSDGRLDEIEGVSRKLTQLENGIERHEFEIERLIMERERQMERRELVRMTDRLEYVTNWRDVAFGSQEAVMMATQAIVELYLMNDDPEGAAEALEKLLGQVDELGSRTAIRFALKDVYMEMDQRRRAVGHMTQIILENARALAGAAQDASPN